MAESDLEKLKENLVRSPSARARFIADLFTMLQQQGVDVDDPDVVGQLDLNLDLRDGKQFASGTLATTNIITITG